MVLMPLMKKTTMKNKKPIKPKKHKVYYCWECSKKLFFPYQRTIIIDGYPRIIHKYCAGKYENNN